MSAFPADIRLTEYDSAEYPHIAMPLGGIGTGNLALCADGSLRQWQLHNIGNHLGALPGSFFALRATRWEPPSDVIRILQATPRESTNTPLVNDDVVPTWQRRLLATTPGVEKTTFAGTYPIARIRYDDPEIPLDIEMEAFNPLVPLDVDTSSIPAAMFTFRIRNTDHYTVHGTLGATVQNAVGWDGASPIDGVHGAGYGGNTNRVQRRDGWTAVVCENDALTHDAPGAGQMVLASDSDRAPVFAQWRRPDEFFAFMHSRALSSGRPRLALATDTPDPQRHAPRAAVGASPDASTWNTGIGVPFLLEPGEHCEVRFALTWFFPNRYVNFEQFGPDRPEWGTSSFWLGNHYATKYADATDVFERVRTQWTDLREATGAWTSTLARSDLDDATVGHMAAQLATIRSPTCFRTADGAFFGFEGVLGASTTMWSGDVGGSCPLNCTHVWNYEQAVAKAFPDLERSMRDTEFDVMQAPDGSIPHRVVLPTYLRQMWDESIGGPEEPALDGMLGTVLKTYREYRNGAGEDWLRRRWPGVARLVQHIDGKWNVDATGLLTGIQPSTHDINLGGLNPFMGTLWLAALRAVEEMANVLDEPGERFRTAFDQASAGYDEALFNGEYYVQRLRPGDRTEYQWADGCLADQLIGQWWAHQLGLGYVLPADHVQTALASVVRHNLRRGFHDFKHTYRVFADGDDSGLLVCTWPTGGRPEVPTRYADEVWTGSEYQVAAHCLREGLHDEGYAILEAMWARFDGRRRNPYNEIECGDHYARSLAGWSVLEALSGFRHDSCAGSFEFAVVGPGAVPFVSSAGWGLVSGDGHEVTIECAGGTIEIRSLVVGGAEMDLSLARMTVGESMTVRAAR